MHHAVVDAKLSPDPLAQTRAQTQDGTKGKTDPVDALGATTPGPPPSMIAGDSDGSERLKATVHARLFGSGALANIGRFEIEDKLGEGGMGVVYVGYDPELDRRVAIKLLRTEAIDGSQGRARLQREARAMAKLSHPNVVHVYEVGTHDEQVYVAMELVSGSTLARWMRERPWSEVLAMFIEAGRGLRAAHDAGLVHRDFKPDNVLVGDDGRPRVVDFGLARGSQAGLADATWNDTAEGGALHADDLTATGTVLGTPAYMAPEQVRGRPTDARTDQFSFCVALYEALYGRRPFQGDTLALLGRAICEGHVEFPPEPALPSHVRDALARGLSTSPSDRFASMTELLAQLEPPSSTLPVPDEPRRSRLWLGLTSLLLAILGIVGILLTPGGDVAQTEPTKRADPAQDADQERAARALARLGGREMVDAAAARAIRCVEIRCKVERDFVDLVMAAPEVLRTQARVAPEFEAGELRALRLHGVRTDSLPGRLGLQNGDRVVRVGGRELSHWDDLEGAVTELGRGDGIQIEYLRGTQRRTVDVEFIPAP